MELHHQLQTLVQQRGEAVLADPDVLRAALEDYLDEQTASTGDLNLLVDAVRLGGLTRLRSALQGGAVPGAAVETAGGYLARQRGSSDVASAQWAVAALGYAVGQVPDQIPTALRQSFTSGGAAPWPPSGAPVVSPAPMMPPPMMSPPQQPWQSGPPAHSGPPPGWQGGPPPGAPYGQPAGAKKSKAPLIAVGAAVAVLAVGGGIAWAVSAGGDDGDKKAKDDPTTSQTTKSGTTEDPDTGGDALETKSPQEIQDAVVADMNEVTSLNMRGNVELDGLEMDLSMDTNGRCTGTLSIYGGVASIISDGTDEYLKGDQKFWIASSKGSTPPASVLDMFVGKWMKTPGTENFASFCDLNNLLDEFDDGSAPDFEVGSTSMVNGREALQLNSDDGSTIYVGNASPHHILRIVGNDTEPGEFLLSQFNQELEIRVPSDYVDNPSS